MRSGLMTTGFFSSTDSHRFNLVLYWKAPTAFIARPNLLLGTRLTRMLDRASPVNAPKVIAHITAAKTTKCLTRMIVFSFGALRTTIKAQTDCCLAVL